MILCHPSRLFGCNVYSGLKSIHIGQCFLLFEIRYQATDHSISRENSFYKTIYAFEGIGRPDAENYRSPLDGAVFIVCRRCRTILVHKY